MSAAFAKLHPKVQEAIWNLGWAELRPLQIDAIDAVLGSEDDLILAAATASGKTEAAFLPILSKIASEPLQSVQALYISPLKALINDQFARLEDLCACADIPVHRWHGDVSATDKQRLKKRPGGVLLITPESLESQFINHDRQLGHIYAQLQFVVIDELHAFLNSVRGIHLRSLLCRLKIAAGVTPRTFGLSATIGDFGPAQSFLSPGAPTNVRILRDESARKEVRIGIKAYEESTVLLGETEEQASGSIPLDSGLDGIAGDVAARFRSDSNLVFCNSRRQTELLADKLRTICERDHWARNPFLLHHGSLSRELREEAERELKAGQPVTAVCTSTLEMGIDLGSVHAIGQVGPTWTVTSLVQRLGRSGRKEGEAQILRVYTLDEALSERSSITHRLRPELIRAIAMTELLREGWLEPPESDRFHFSTCVHQIMSVLRQTGGAPAPHLYDVLCQRGAFVRLHKERFAELLRGMASKQLIEQVPTGEVILAPAGERIVESRDFYAAFASRIEYQVEYDNRPIGLLPQDSLPAEGEFLLLNGRRWRVNVIDHHSRRVSVTPAKGWKQPRFGGGIATTHPVVTKRMRAILGDGSGYAYLNGSASQMLQEARRTFEECGLVRNDVLTTFNGIEWFPWQGGRVLRTLQLCAKVDGLQTDRDDLCLRYRHINASEFLDHRHKISSGAFSAEDLLKAVPDRLRDRFDEYVSDELLGGAFIAESLDLSGARTAAAS